MLELCDIKGYLTGYNLAEVSRQTGVNYHVLCRIMRESGVNGYDPRYSDIKRLESFLVAKGHIPS